VVPAQYAQAVHRGRLPGGAVLLGEGWYPPEQSAGELFRWMRTEAEIVLAPWRGNRRTIHLDVEPNPASEGQPLQLDIRDSNGLLIASHQVRGRQRLTIAVPAVPERLSVLRLHLDAAGSTAPGDPRSLTLRVFQIQPGEG
jgi:hypothetical protein